MNKQETFEVVVSAIRAVTGTRRDKITRDMRLGGDLIIDELDEVVLMMELDDLFIILITDNEFAFRDPRKTVGDLVDFVESKVAKATEPAP